MAFFRCGNNSGASDVTFSEGNFTIAENGGTIEITCGFKPKKIIVYRGTTATPNTVCVYDKDVSETQFYQNSSTANRWINLQNASPAIMSISDVGFTYRGASGTNVAYKYIAIG